MAQLDNPISSRGPACPYCQGTATFRTDSRHIYVGQDHGPVWECFPCNAYVGCHKGTNVPLGTLANRELRAARKAAHAIFDPLWVDGRRPRIFAAPHTRARRDMAYAWLARSLGIPLERCHIGMFDLATCQRVVELCRKRRGIAHAA